MPGSTPHDSAPVLRGLDSESRQMVADMIRQLGQRLLSRDKILEFDKKDIFPEAEIRELLSPDIGLQLLFIPEAYGGMGGGARDSCLATREMSKICLGVATAFFAIQLGADPLIVGGTREQKEKWLGAIAGGDCLVSYAVTEPGAGSNLAALQTSAEPVEDDSGNIKGYRINGNKQFISTGGYSDFITLLANTPEGPTFFVVEKDAEGFSRGKGEEKHGIRSSNTSPLSFSDVFVPVENLIGGVPGKGLKQSNAVFGYTRLMVASMALGAGEAALDIVIPYAAQRRQFGSFLSEKQGYTHKLVVPHAVRLAAADAYCDEIALRLDSGEKDLQTEGSIAKYFASEAANQTADDAIQALGGYGYIAEYGVEKIKRDVKITCIYEGTSEIQQNIISVFRWKKTRKTKGAFYEGIASEMKAAAGSGKDLGAESFALAAAALNPVIEKVQKARLTRSQHVMFALADMMTHVEVGAALARKAAALMDAGDPDAEKTRLMSRIFAAETARTVCEKTLEILSGSGAFSKDEVSAFLKSVSYDDMILGQAGVIQDMDALADILFGRRHGG
ncbi:Acyl-CoA dehydrogenase [Candidatus Desulfarcum epimagneticum]|uniref:Acyl-CoA dehydrogenase n=1 Tax=uncultured Desulfobacteraceae bacterium TaxID=218296 RepID=A0A484HLV3_9BACT|nr:Acyl-CoA dehydrogenase [uncultured Desulfobacteraceae bacterium]